MSDSLKVYCFPYEFQEDESENLHNVSLAIGVMGRKNPLGGEVQGSIAVGIDDKGDEVFASINIIMEEAEVHDYWGEGTAQTWPHQFTVYNLIPRTCLGNKDGRWYPKTDSGRNKAITAMLKDNSDFVIAAWRSLTKSTFDVRDDK